MGPPLRPLTALLAAGLLLSQASCLLPIRRAPAAEGKVLDARTGQPVAGALVVVRFDAWYDDVLPDRELLGHREVRTDARGRFRAGPVTQPGISAWPLLRTEARIVGVLADGYRCPAPQAMRGKTRLRLVPADDIEDRRASCRPVAARGQQAGEYMRAWRALFPVDRSRETREEQRELDRMLEARSVFGFGENCLGPVLDLALDPAGQRAALMVKGEGGIKIQAVDLRPGGRSRPRVVSKEPVRRYERLAWTSPRELVLWEPATQASRAISGSILGSGRLQVVWTAPADETLPAAPDLGGSGPSRPLDPTDLNDEGDARWMGRSFQMRRDVRPETGLALDRLTVMRPDGSSYRVELPGEVCGPRGRFGRPHYRITADGRSGLDLRFVEGGCHAVRVDLLTGAWRRIDGADRPAQCQRVRSVPAQQLATAARGYMRDVASALQAAKADPGVAYALHIDAKGATRAITRDLKGGKHTVRVPPFPIATPLKRIELTVAGGRSPWLSSPAPAPAPAAPSPL